MRTCFVAALLSLALSASAQDVPASDAPEASIVTVLQEDGRFTVLVRALEQTNLVETLSGPGPFTVFAPTDSAFESLPEGALESLTPEQLQAVLLGHVVAGSFSGAQAAEAGQAPSAWSDQPLTFTSTEAGLAVNDVPIVQTDLAAPNGVIHVIDGVLLPSSEADGLDDGDMGDGDLDDGDLDEVPEGDGSY